jgi:hypothetical protein
LVKLANACTQKYYLILKLSIKNAQIILRSSVSLCEMFFVSILFYFLYISVTCAGNLSLKLARLNVTLVESTEITENHSKVLPVVESQRERVCYFYKVTSKTHCGPVGTFFYEVNITDYKLVAEVNFTNHTDPYVTLTEHPFKALVEEVQINNLKHLEVIYDNAIKNYVLKVVIHRDFDVDGNILNPKNDRQRIEFAATNNSSPSILGYPNDTMIYMWWFKLSKNIRPSNNFFHIFQLKTGNNKFTMPVFTFSLSKKGQKEHLTCYYQNTTYTIGPLTLFLGVWVQAFVKIHLSKDGYISYDLRNLQGEKFVSLSKQIMNVHPYNSLWEANFSFIRYIN